jgi:hypothetical protein
MDRAIASGAIGREFESLRAHHSGLASFPQRSFAQTRLRVSAAGSRFAHARKTPQVRISPGAPFRSGFFSSEILRPNQAQDFGCGLPLRSRPQNASSSNLSGRTIPVWLLFLRDPSPKPGSGFRLRAPASLTPAKHLKFESLRAHHSADRPLPGQSLWGTFWH